MATTNKSSDCRKATAQKRHLSYPEHVIYNLSLGNRALYLRHQRNDSMPGLFIQVNWRDVSHMQCNAVALEVPWCILSTAQHLKCKTVAFCYWLMFPINFAGNTLLWFVTELWFPSIYYLFNHTYGKQFTVLPSTIHGLTGDYT